MRIAAHTLLLVAIGCSPGERHEPSVEPLAVETEEDKAVRITAFATDVDGDDLEVRILPSSGSVTTQRLSPSRDASGTRLEIVMVFHPAAQYSGETGITLSVSDGEARVDAFVDVAVTPVNDKPIAKLDLLAASADTPLVVFPSTLLANDTDPDAEYEDREATELSLSTVAKPFRGTVTLDQGLITFVPEAGFTGTASFEYTLSDGAATGSVTVRVAVAGPNATPIASDDQLHAMEGEILKLRPPELTGNDVDHDGHALAVIAVSNPMHGTVEVEAGIVTFTPEESFYFGPASFDYTVTDGVAIDTAHVDIEYAPWL